jgi:hypothetical protein
LAGKDFIRQGLDGHPLYWHQLLPLKHKISYESFIVDDNPT